MKFIKGFTLSEILVTIGIIGVIAAMTMPALIQNYQKQQTVERFKKAYSEISQALKLAEAEYGPIETWDFSMYSAATGERTTRFAEDYLYPYMKILKKCTPSSSECFKPSISLSNSSPYMYNQSVNHLSAITTSGYSFYFWVSTSNNNSQIWIDIDGPLKGKSMLGKDLFGIGVNMDSSSTASKLGVFPQGLNVLPPLSRDELINTAQHGCSNSIVHAYAGRYCAGLIAVDGWKISDDYPWK